MKDNFDFNKYVRNKTLLREFEEKEYDSERYDINDQGDESDEINPTKSASFAILPTADMDAVEDYLANNPTGIKYSVDNPSGPSGGWPEVKYTGTEQDLKDMIAALWARDEDPEEWYNEIKPMFGNVTENN